MASSLSAFLGEIGRHQLLTPEQELTLGRRVQAMAQLQERCREAGGSGPACAFDDLERRTLKTGERAKNQMITANLRLVVNLAKRYQNVSVQGAGRLISNIDPVKPLTAV